MEQPFILHMITPLKHVSPFDVNMALDAGFDAVLPYGSVELSEVQGLVRDAIFSRGPPAAKRTGFFIGGRDLILGLDMLDAAKGAMVPPFEVSVFADPAGSFTTAAAMVACVEHHLDKAHGLGLSGRRVVVFGATGVVGFAAGVIAGQEGAEVTLAGYDGAARVKARAGEAKARFGVDLSYADASNDDLKLGLIEDAEIVLSAGRAGTQVLSRSQLAAARDLKVVADVNAVPPAGIEGVGLSDDGAEIEGSPCVGIGALGVGQVKVKVEADLFKRMLEASRPVYLDFIDAFKVARERVG